MACFIILKLSKAEPMKQMVSCLQLGTILKVCCEVIVYRLYCRWQQREICCYSPFYRHSAAIIQNLWLSSERGCNHGWKSISRTSGKIKKLAQCQQGQGLVQEKRRDFFPHHFNFPFAKGNQPAAPKSLLLVRARSWSCSELLVM